MPLPQTRNLLIVEDDVDARDLYREMFEALGWRIVTTGSSDEALRLLRMYPFDAAIVDHELGGSTMNGVALVTIILEERVLDARKIILTSGHEMLEGRPFDVRFVRKPIEPRTMSTMLGRIVEPVPLVTVYICGHGLKSLEAVQFVRSLVKGRRADLQIIDVLGDDQKMTPEAQISFTPKASVHYKNERWRFDGAIRVYASTIIACLDYLESRMPAP